MIATNIIVIACKRKDITHNSNVCHINTIENEIKSNILTYNEYWHCSSPWGHRGAGVGIIVLLERGKVQITI